ncbi:MAG: MFS transporter [Janthinobacterium lividum]
MHSASTDDVADHGVQGSVGVMPILVMMSGLASQSLLFSLPPPLLPVMAGDFGANGGFITQMLMAVASLGLMITSIVSGAAVRAVGVRGILIVSAAIYGLAGIVPFATANPTLLLVSRLFVGGACGLFTTGCTMLLSHSYVGTARARALGYQTSIGSVLGLIVLVIAGASVKSVGWHPAFLLYGVFALPLVLFALVGVPAVPLPPGGNQPGFAEAFGRIWPILVAACLLMMVPILVGGEVPFILAAVGVTVPLIQSAVISMITIMAAVGGALFGSIQTRLGVRRTFAAALLVAALGFALIGFAANAWVAALGCAFYGIGLGLYIPHLWVLATSLVSERIRGHAIGLLTTSMFLGGFLYPFLFGPLQKAVGLGGAFEVVALLLAIAAIGMLMARRARLAGAV